MKLQITDFILELLTTLYSEFQNQNPTWNPEKSDSVILWSSSVLERKFTFIDKQTWKELTLVWLKTYARFPHQRNPFAIHLPVYAKVIK